ncbi:MAG: (Fe-S)-binding protein [Thermodesulfobacteriota bacterium]
MAERTPVRYYRPKSEFKFDISDLENFVYDMSRCIKCKGCTWVDHTYMPGPKFMTRCPSAAKFEFDAYGAYGKMRIGHALAEGVLGWSDKALEVIYACTLCGACDVGCKRNLDLEIELALESLRVKAVKDGAGPPPAYRNMAENISRRHNVYGAPHLERTSWVPAGTSLTEKADLLYFVGCSASYVNREIARSTARILTAAGTEFMLMPDEWCCGNIVFSAGLFDQAQALARRNVEEVRKTGAKVLLTGCAEGYRMWKVDYPKLLEISTGDLGFQVVHLVEYAAGKIEDGRLKMKKPFETRLTYHDACSLNRLSQPWTPYAGKRGWMGCVEPRLQRRRGNKEIYALSRAILTAIPGVNLVEMPRTRENAFCCGAGRGVQTAYPDLAGWAARHRLEEVSEIGAETLVSACPWCKNNFTQAVRDNGGGVRVLDISEVIQAALEA